MPQDLRQNKYKTFPIREKSVPTLGTLHSHGGNVSFPGWEHYKITQQHAVPFWSNLKFDSN